MGALAALHVGCLVLWLAAGVLAEALLRLGSRHGANAASARRRVRPLVLAEHAALAVALAAGWGLMQGHGWSIGHPRWLGVKLLLVAFLVVPLEALHAWASHVWIARGLSQAGAAGELRRGLAMEAMVRTLEAVLLSLALPLQVWLSRARPF